MKRWFFVKDCLEFGTTTLLVDGNGETTLLQIQVSNHLLETTVVLSIRCLTFHKRILGEMIQFDEGEIMLVANKRYQT